MMPNVSSNNDLSSRWLTNSGTTTLAIGIDRRFVVNASVVDLYRRPLAQDNRMKGAIATGLLQVPLLLC